MSDGAAAALVDGVVELGGRFGTPAGHATGAAGRCAGLAGRRLAGRRLAGLVPLVVDVVVVVPVLVAVGLPGDARLEDDGEHLDQLGIELDARLTSKLG